MKYKLLCALLPLTLALVTFAQQKSPTLSFEVASIKPAEPQAMNMIRMGMQVDGSLMRYSNVSLKDVIRVAYKVKDFQIEGPDWLAKTRFDINAKLPAGATEEQVPEMLQSLLAERFQMTMHKESKDSAIYALIPGKDGPKLKPSEVQAAGPADRDSGPNRPPVPPPPGPETRPGPAGAPPRGMMRMMVESGGSIHLQAASSSLANVADALSRFTERPILDMTSISGQYEFDLVFTPEKMPMAPKGMGGPPPGAAGADGGPSEPGPSIFEAVQAYGLKLEPRKAPMDLIVVDHIEKTPTEN
jgi:uncharacterized protein (TIGR03435 family)